MGARILAINTLEACAELACSPGALGVSLGYSVFLQQSRIMCYRLIRIFQIVRSACATVLCDRLEPRPGCPPPCAPSSREWSPDSIAILCGMGGMENGWMDGLVC